MAAGRIAEAVDAYYNAMFDMGRVLLRGFSMAIGEEPTFLDRYVTKPPSQLRLIHYPFDASAEDRPGIGAHTDYECFTLLKPTAPGLDAFEATLPADQAGADTDPRADGRARRSTRPVPPRPRSASP